MQGLPNHVMEIFSNFGIDIERAESTSAGTLLTVDPDCAGLCRDAGFAELPYNGVDVQFLVRAGSDPGTNKKRMPQINKLSGPPPTNPGPRASGKAKFHTAEHTPAGTAKAGSGTVTKALIVRPVGQ